MLALQSIVLCPLALKYPVLLQNNIPVSSHENVPVPLHENVPAIGYSSCNITV